MTVRNLTEARRYIAHHRTFTCGNVSAREVRTELLNSGRLPKRWQERLAVDIIEAREVRAYVYVVLSYGTPIAWVTSDRVVVIPDATYSTTTTKHQNMVREALGASNGEGD